MVRWNQALILVAVLLLALACSEEQGSVDAAPADQSTREGIVFPDTRIHDSVGPLDAPPWQEASSPDGPAADAPPVDQQLIDQQLPDLLAPDQPIPACSSWSHYSCQPGSFPTICTATCALSPLLVVRCTSAFIRRCTCLTNGATVGTTSASGLDCSACQNAMSYCFSKF